MELDWDSRALDVLRRLEAAGFPAVLVGGCVRDMLLSRRPHDYDIATAALPQQIKQACRGLECVDTGLAHGTVTVLSGGLAVEGTTFRREGSYADHRHPDHVEFTADLGEDLGRRDFTVNAMAWGPRGLYDPFSGLEDLRARVLRCVGEPRRRFEEDALRILRCARLSAQLDFSVHPGTAAAMDGCLSLLDLVSRERVGGELIRLLCAPGACRVLLERPALVTRIIPELAPAVGFEQHTRHHSFDVYGHTARVVGGTPPLPRLRLAALLHDVGKPATFSLDAGGAGHFYGHARESARLAGPILRRLRVDNATRERAVVLISNHANRFPPQERVVKRWMGRLGVECFFDLMALCRADARGKHPDRSPSAGDYDRLEEMARAILAREECFTLRQLEVNGRDALAAGLEGPAVGAALDKLLDAVVEGVLPNRRQDLLRALEGLARSAPSRPSPHETGGVPRDGTA